MELRYSDDGDAFVDVSVHDRQGGELNWPAPEAQARQSPEQSWVTLPASWYGFLQMDQSGASTRMLRVELSGLGTKGRHEIRLAVPGDNDIPIGTVNLI